MKSETLKVVLPAPGERRWLYLNPHNGRWVECEGNDVERYRHFGYRTATFRCVLVDPDPADPGEES